jgi:hypothetical protein
MTTAVREERKVLTAVDSRTPDAVADQVAVIPFVYGRSTALIRPHVQGWWEFAKSSANFADLLVEQPGD